MPFVSIRLIENRSQQQKDEIAKRVNDAISDVLQLPKDDIWVVFEDIPAGLVCRRTTVAELRKKADIGSGGYPFVPKAGPVVTNFIPLARE